MATLSPTAANILSSLGILGASVSGGPEHAGKAPVIGPNGKLDLSLIPVDEISSVIDIPALGKTAFVDKDAGSGDSDYTPNGSIAFPFPTLSAAADSDEHFSSFVIVSGDYLSDLVVFSTTASVIRIFSTGTASFSGLTLYGYPSGTQLLMDNVSVNGTLTLAANVSCSLQLSGNGSITVLKGAVDDESDPISSPWYLSEVRVGSEFAIASYVYVDMSKISYMSTSARVANSSTVVSGKTVKDATDRLGLRRIRIPTFSADTTGIHADSDEDIPVDEDSSDSYGYHDIREMGTTLAAAANATFYKKGDSPTFDTVTAEGVKANYVQAVTVHTASVHFGNAPVYVDASNFLTVGELDSSDSSVYPRIDDGDVILYPADS